MQNVKMDLSQIGKADTDNIGRTFLEAVRRFYDNPENTKAFENWKAKREEMSR